MQRGKIPAYLRKALFAATFSLFAGQAVFATQTAYSFHENGASESPAQSTNGVGDGTVIYDNVAHVGGLDYLFRLERKRDADTFPRTDDHFRSAGAGPKSRHCRERRGYDRHRGRQSQPAGFSSDVTSGTYNATLDLTQQGTYNTTYFSNNGGTPASAEAAFISALQAGKVYENIHTTSVPGGEIRGFPALVPEPTTAAVAAIGTCMLRRRLRRQ